jgi:hypothetical protein
MAWESRRGRRYYYRKRRIGRKVVTEYLGRGPLADREARRTAKAKARQSSQWIELQQLREEQDRLKKQIDEGSRLLSHYLAAVMLTNGYHLHKRQWRKQHE